MPDKIPLKKRIALKEQNEKNKEQKQEVLKKEYHGFFAIIVIFTFMEVVGDLIYQGKLEVDTMWCIICGTGFLVWVSMRIIVKKTNMLSDAN